MKQKIITGLAALVLGVSLVGCTGAGAVLMGSNDPGARTLGTLMYHEGAHKDRMKEAREGKTDVNVYGSGQQTDNKRINGRWKTIKIVDLDTKELEVHMTGGKQISFIRYIDKLTNEKRHFPKKGYRVFISISDTLHSSGLTVDYFTVIREIKDGQMIYTISDKK